MILCSYCLGDKRLFHPTPNFPHPPSLLSHPDITLPVVTSSFNKHCIVCLSTAFNSYLLSTYCVLYSLGQQQWIRQAISLLSKGLDGRIKTSRLCVLVTQLYPTVCDPMNFSLPGSSVLGILQAGMLEWVAIPFSRGSSWSRDWTQVSHITGRFFMVWATREAPSICK